MTGTAPLDSLDPTAQLVCRAADELESTATISDRTFEQLYETLGVREATELLFIVSFYCAVARFSKATRAQVEKDNPLAAAANPNEPPLPEPLVHVYFHDTDLLDRRRASALELGLRLLRLRRRPGLLDGSSVPANARFPYR